nr:caltractin [Quercus suber]
MAYMLVFVTFYSFAVDVRGLHQRRDLLKLRKTFTKAQPPKRKQPAATSSAKPTPAKRRSKLAKENDISADEELEIQEAVKLFLTEDEIAAFSPTTTTLSTADVRRCLIALNTPPANTAEWREIVETVDPEDTGTVGYEHFLGIAALKLRQRGDVEDADARAEEVRRAYALFTRGEDRTITLADLQRVARDMKENVSDGVLRDMIKEAKAGAMGGVGMEEFADVMKRAGVLG